MTAATMASPLRAWSYARVSHDKRGGRSTGEQHDANRGTIDSHGWVNEREITDDDESASPLRKHDPKGWATIREGIANQALDVLVVWSASRAQRDVEEYAKLRRLLKDSGVLLCYDGTVYDMGKRSDRFRTGIDAIIAEDYAAQVQESVMRALNTNAEQGKPHGQTPFGYVRKYREVPGQKEQELVGQFIDPVNGPLVQEAAERFLSGETLLGIAKDWNSRGIETPYKAKWGWQSTQIRRILTVPAVNGKLVHQGQVVREGSWPAILDDITYARVQARLNDPARQQGARESVKAKLLTGVARCGKCGGPMTFVRNRKPGKEARTLYTCRYNRHVARDMNQLDAYVERTLLTWVKSGDIGLPDESAENVTEARALISQLRAQIEDAFQQFKAGNLSGYLLGRTEADNTAQIKELEKSIRVSNVPTSASDLMTSDDPEGYWKSLNVEQRREILRAMVDVTIHGTIYRGRKGTLEKESISITPR